MAANFAVERSQVVQAPPERVYRLLQDLQQWTRWSPWEDVDPDLKRAYAGAEAGVGQTYAWAGNRKAGSGRMEIVAAEENRSLDVDVEFMKPFKSVSRCTFMLAPAGESTVVTWRMTGPRPLPMRALGPLLSMDRLVGKDFEKGLARLAEVARPKPAG